jgi:hypothetical protein
MLKRVKYIVHVLVSNIFSESRKPRVFPKRSRHHSSLGTLLRILLIIPRTAEWIREFDAECSYCRECGDLVDRLDGRRVLRAPRRFQRLYTILVEAFSEPAIGTVGECQ